MATLPPGGWMPVVGSLAAALAASAALAVQPQTAHGVLHDALVRQALEAARAGEPQTIDDQVRFCETPAPPFKEGARGDLLRRAFTALGLEHVRVDRVGNVLGDRPGTRATPRLVVSAHLDTVFPEETPVKVTRQGSVLRGPGIGDNCRGLAVLVAVARQLAASAVRTPGSITFVATVGEEGLGDLRGVKALFGETLRGRIDRFVSIDNAGIHIGTSAVGSRRYRITFKGPGGHSFADFGMPNPAGALGRAVAAIGDLQMPPDSRSTFNVGRLGGGTSVNAIPDSAWMEVDLRSASAAALAALDARLLAAVDRAAADENARWRRPGVVTVVKELVGDRPVGSTARDAPIALAAQAVALAVGVEASFSESSSDANLPMSLNIPAIVIGAGGRSWESHTVNERFDTTDSWKGTANAVLLTIALAR